MKRIALVGACLFLAGCDQALLAPDTSRVIAPRTTASTSTTGYMQVSTGDSYSCALTAAGRPVCWGSNDVGQASPPPGTFKQIYSGNNYSCGIKTDDGITCWGVAILIPWPAGSFKEVAFSLNHGCAIETDDTLACWGYNDHGQSTPPTGTFKHVVGGDGFGCAIRTDDTLSCWGDNSFGVTTPPGGTFKQLGRAGGHACAVRTDDTVTCWGYNGFGESAPPAATFKQVDAAGSAYSCGIRTDDTIVCWGYSGTGRLDAPTGTFKQLASGGIHSCAIRSDNTIACWGDNSSGQATPPAATTTVATSSPTSQQYSDKTNLSATVGSATDAGPISGTVQFKIDGVNAGAAQTVSSGIATLSDYQLTQTAGNHLLTAEFTSTNASYAGSVSDNQNLVVSLEDAVVTASVDNPAALTATGAGGTASTTLSFQMTEKTPDVAALAGAPGSGYFMYLSVTVKPQGSTAQYLTCTNSVTGSAYETANTLWCPTGDLPAGTYEVHAFGAGSYYAGEYTGSLTVIPGTTTSVSGTANQQYSDFINLSATVSPAAASGTVQFKIDGINIGTPQAVTGGSAALNNYPLVQAAGSHTLTADFTSSTSGYGSSSGTGSLNVLAEAATLSANIQPGFSKAAPNATTDNLTFSFTMNETTPDQAALTAAPGNPAFLTLTVVLHPQVGTDVSLPCTYSSTGTGYKTKVTAKCANPAVPIGDYELRANISGGYFAGSFAGAYSVLPNKKAKP
jgi:hypothetical protein